MDKATRDILSNRNVVIDLPETRVRVNFGGGVWIFDKQTTSLCHVFFKRTYKTFTSWLSKSSERVKIRTLRHGA